MELYIHRKLKMTTQEIQNEIDMIRLAYRDRNQDTWEPSPLQVFAVWTAAMLAMLGIVAVIIHTIL